MDLPNLFAPPTQLSDTPKTSPRHSVSIENRKGEKEDLGDPKTTRALVALMNQHAVIGGAAAHWGGPAALAEIMSSIHAIMFRENKWFDHYNFVNDAGHTENGVYALRANLGYGDLTFDDLKKFRSIESPLTGHGEAHLYPEGVYISNGPLGSGVAQAQGLAIADKLIGNKRTTICTVSDGASMEGEAKEAFASIPGLASKGKMNPFVLVVSDNNTKLSGRIDDDAFDMSPTFKSLETLGWETKFITDGHNLELVHKEIDSAVERAQNNTSKPIALVFKTIKGYGVKSTEESASGGHGYPLKAYDSNLVGFIDEIFDGNAPEEFTNWAKDILNNKPEDGASSGGVKKEKVQVGIANALIDAKKKGYPVFSITSDLQGSTGVAGFHKAYPDSYIDMGVAEANMVSSAIGLSKKGFIPIVDTFSQFAITKGNLPLIMAGLSEGPMIGVFSHTGFQDAADGASHQATTYFAAVSSIPHVKVINCSCSSEAYALMSLAIEKFVEDRKQGKTPDSTIFFLGRENHPQHYLENASYKWNEAQVLKSGKDAVVVTSGPLLDYALLAYESLKSEGIEISVVNHPFVNTPDVKTLSEELAKCKGKLITLEDHQLIGGMGAQICHALKLAKVDFDLHSMANNGQFGRSAYKAKHLYEMHGLDDKHIVKWVKGIQ